MNHYEVRIERKNYACFLNVTSVHPLIPSLHPSHPFSPVSYVSHLMHQFNHAFHQKQKPSYNDTVKQNNSNSFCSHPPSVHVFFGERTRCACWSNFQWWRTRRRNNILDEKQWK